MPVRARTSRVGIQVPPKNRCDLYLLVSNSCGCLRCVAVSETLQQQLLRTHDFLSVGSLQYRVGRERPCVLTQMPSRTISLELYRQNHRRDQGGQQPVAAALTGTLTGGVHRHGQLGRDS